jgi:choline dehydrogenase-like flavoprotein
MEESVSNIIYDAIVVGTGITGGWAAKELCEKGCKTLVLERGRMVEHIKDYPTMNKDPWDFEYRGVTPQHIMKDYDKQKRTGWTIAEGHRHFFVKDSEHPYNEIKRFDWIRGYQVGGRSLVWGRQSYRWSNLDFEANKKEGIAIDWPIRYEDISDWYDYVEDYIGVSGEALGLTHLPDGVFLPPMELNCIEDHLKTEIAKHYQDRLLTIGRVAHITEGSKPGLGRGSCQYRDRCMRGCPFGAYFTSNSSTLPAATNTGNMTLRPNSIVKEIIYDESTGLAIGVKVIDANTQKVTIYKSRVIFLCASTVGSTSILMNSKSDRFPNGLGNDSGELGHNIMDHHFKAGATATFKGFDDKYFKGRRPNGIYIPRFRNLGGDTDKQDFVRGYGYQGGASRSDYSELIAEIGYGEQLKELIVKPGEWSMILMGFGEVLPHHENRIMLDYNKKDQWGLPTVTFDAEFKENELSMRKDMVSQAVEMLKKAGFEKIEEMDLIGAPGLGIHEMGTARMGKDPKTSVLNANNQIHTVPNVYVTDGSCLTSGSCVNPSLTYMALTARAANHAANLIQNKVF